MSCHFLLQGIFPAQGSNWQSLLLLHWQAGSVPIELLGRPELYELFTHLKINPLSVALFASSFSHSVFLSFSFSSVYGSTHEF